MDGEIDGWDFVKLYIKVMDDVTDAPYEYKEACALYLISTFVGRNFFFLSAPEASIFKQDANDLTQMGGRLLNLWFILIGKSRVARKSTIISKAREAVEIIDSNLILPEDFTPEKLLSILSQHNRNGVTHVTWIRDEVSGFFKALRREYMLTTDTILSKLYDGQSITRATVLRGEEPVRNPYITTLLGSTEILPTYFDDELLRQGFLNRFIYVVGKRRIRMPLKPFISQETLMLAQQIKNYLEILYRIPNVIPMNFSGEAWQIYNDYEEKIENDLENVDFDIAEGYYGNLPNFVIRLSAIFRLSRMSVDDIREFTEPVLVIERIDIERALSYVTKVWDWFQQVITLKKTYATSKPVQTEENKIEMVYNIITSAGGKITRSELYRKAKLTVTELEEVINTLVAQSRVKIVKVETGGRPRIEYHVLS